MTVHAATDAASAWDLAKWDAVETAERIARRDVTAREVVEAAIARAEERGALNAIVTPTFDDARARASTATGPLAGVPFFIKDLFPVAGVRTAWGSGATGTFIAKKSGPEIARLQRVGLVSLGKSATPEYGLTATTEPLAFGPCHNPWAMGHSTGGSSGGAAALVASGVVPLAHASDGGGSIRIPAACCGLVGLKPTRGRFDMTGSNLLPVNVAVHGCVTRTVRDTVAFWRSMNVTTDHAPGTVKIGMFTTSPAGGLVDDEIVLAVHDTANALRELGHTVKDVACPIPRVVVDDFVALWGFLAYMQGATHRMMTGGAMDATKLEPLTQSFATRFRSRVWGSFREMKRLRSWTRDYERALAELDVDVLLLPTLAMLPPRHGYLATDVPFDQALARLYAFCPFTGPFNSSGAPAISLPLARSKGGLPIGVQLASSRGRDGLLLELALELERARPWPHMPPSS